MKKNTATKWIVFAFTRADNVPKTGDAAQITANVFIDGAAANAVDDVNPAELGAGYYLFEISAAECNGDLIIISPASSTAGVQVIGVPGAVWTDTLAADVAALPTAAAVADLPTVAEFEARSIAAADYTVVADLPAAGASQASVDAVKVDTAAILTDTGTTLDAAIAAVKAETALIVADTAELQTDWVNGGRLDLILDAASAPSAAAVADAVWDEAIAGHATAGTTGKALTDAGGTGTPLDAAGVRAAVGLASANLDAQIADLPTVAELEARSLVAADYTVVADLPAAGASQASVDAVKAETALIVEDTAVIGALGAGLTALSTQASVNLVKAKTDNLPAIPAAAGDVPTAAAIVAAVWNEATAGHAAAGSTGKALTDAGGAGTPLDAAGVRAAVGLASANLDTQIADLPTVAELGARSLLAADYTVVTDLPTPPSAAAITDAVWDEVTADHMTAGTAGKALRDAGSLGNPLDAAGFRAAIGLASANLDTQLETKPAAAAIADAVWDEAAADHVAALTTGNKLGVAASSNPTAASIADAVWDEATADHVASGSAGAAIVATLSAIYPSLAAIAAAVWAKVITGAISAETALASLYNGFSSYATAGAGPGAIATTITISVASPILPDGVEVWISTDIEGATVIAGTLITDAFGQAVFMLDAGTYFLWKQKSGVNFTNPETIVVS